jgi:putative DNA primase/helicase
VLSLWTQYTWVYERFEYAPILAILSPEKRCGKSRTLGMLKLFCNRSLAASNLTEAALFRAVHALHPTLLIDEGDTFISGTGSSQGLRNVFNSGHAKSGATVLRAAGAHNFCAYNVFCPKAIAMIGTLPSTLADRSIAIRLQRKRPEEAVGRVPNAGDARASRLRSALADWASRNESVLAEIKPEIPSGLHDRARDNWRPLLSVADAVGGSWPAQARAAAIELTRTHIEEQTPAVQLLHDTRAYLEGHRTDVVTSSDLIRWLCGQDDRPWRHYRRGGPLSPHQLASLFGIFDIRPAQMWVDGRNLRGYRREMFTEAFSRYL